jgi:hypothetical protein
MKSNIILVYFVHDYYLLNVNIEISQNDFWTNFGRILNYNLKIVLKCKNWTWMSFMHAYNMCFFCVLVLKVDAMYYEQLLAIVLKEFECMNMS